jgi:enoyl-CoA hydratase/carnithine racemase
MHHHIVVDRIDGVGRITFNRPEVLNAFTPAMLAEVKAALSAFEEDAQVRSILFIGKGTSFSSGGDLGFLDELTSATPTQIKDNVYRYFAGTVRAVKLCPKPTIAAVRGHAVTAGCELAIACDIRIASETAVFAESWIKLGLTAPLGGLVLLPRIVGLTKATEMLLTGRRVLAKEAEHIGLVTRVVPDDKLEEEAMAVARDLAAGPPRALAAVKDGLRRGLEGRLADEMDFALFNQATLICSEDYKEGLAALKARRAPRFTGR